jgi:gliding motility-associated-like protein
MKKVLLLLLLLSSARITFSQVYKISDYNGKTLDICKGQFTSSKFTTSTDGLNSVPGYGNNENYTVTFRSGDPKREIRANFFYIDLETNLDILYIYDGLTATGTPIAKLTGGLIKFPGVYTSTGGALTFKFTSNGSTAAGSSWGGWDAFLGCTPVSCGANQPASDECSSATPICNLGGYCGSTSGWYTRGKEAKDIDTITNGAMRPFCGETHNNSWLSFVAATTSATFEITPSNCSDPTKGMQAVILESNDCITFVRKSYCFYDVSGSFKLTGNNLTVGKKYYIMVDGATGNDCDYTILAKSGVQTINITATNSNTLCSGQPLVVTANATGIGPFTYKWSPKPASANSDSSTVTFPVSVNTTYTCTVTGVCGTPTIATYTPSANTTPVVVATDSAHICRSGNGATLSASVTSSSPSITFNNFATSTIPDNDPVGNTSSIIVGNLSGNVGAELQKVCFSADHGNVSELTVGLKAPDGTVIDLTSNNGGAGSNYVNTCFVPSGAPAVTGGTSPFTGNYTPEQPFSNLSASAMNGTWSLIVKDTKANGTGLLKGWTIAFKNNLSYSWSPATGLSTTTGSTVTANPAATTIYTVTVTDRAGCSNSKPVNVRVTQTPAAPTVITPVIYCIGAMAAPLSASGNGLLWFTTATGGTGSSTAPTPNTSVAGSFDYYVASVAETCEGDRAKITVIVNKKTDASFSYSSSSFCQNTTNQFPIISPGAVAGTFKATPAGLVFVNPTTGEIDLKASTPGTYVITNEIAPIGGCSTIISDPFTLTIHPEPYITNSSTAQVCSGVPLNISLTSNVASSYSWIAADNTNTTGETNSTPKLTDVINDVIINNTSSPQVVKYTITLTSKTGACINLKPQTIDVTVNPEPTLSNSSKAVVCSGSAPNISLTSNVASNYSWMATDNPNTNGETYGNPKHTDVIDDKLYNNTSSPQVVTYTVTLTSKTGACINLKPQTIEVTIDKTVAEFTADPKTGEKPLSVHFNNATSGSTQYSWDFGNGETSSEANPVNIYTETGHFTACLTATTSNSCSDKKCMSIDVYINTTFLIPNVFTPNSDGKNDLFTITGKGILSLRGEIFNRWGQKEYEWNTINGGWDGHSASGIPCNEGTYYILLQVIGEDGKTYSANQAITLLR